MKQIRRISLFTLLGLILPLGNIWGPYIVNVPVNSVEAKFRKKLVLFEVVLTVIFFVIATVLMAKSMSADFNMSIFMKALKVFLIEDVIIVAAAFISPLLVRYKD